MRAIVIDHPGGPEVLTVQEVDPPEQGSTDLLVRVRATALNRADILQRRGLYPPPAGVSPDIPGLEFAGEVEETGRLVSGFKKGDRVMGLLPGEGYAEKVVTPERMVLPIPESLNFVQAAAVPEVFLTAYDALFLQLGLSLGETILIHAVGSGVGTAALQLAKAARCFVFGTSGSQEKLGRARSLGLDRGIDRHSEDFKEVVQSETRGRGLSAILDLVGADYWEKNLDCLEPRGRLILVGLLGGSKATTNLSAILRKRLKIVGTVLRGRPIEEKITLTQRFRQHLLPLFESEVLRPVVDRAFPLEEAAEAHRYMESNQNFGKIVLVVS